jgi:hypothetical protein
MPVVRLGHGAPPVATLRRFPPPGAPGHGCSRGRVWGEFRTGRRVVCSTANGRIVSCSGGGFEIRVNLAARFSSFGWRLRFCPPRTGSSSGCCGRRPPGSAPTAPPRALASRRARCCRCPATATTCWSRPSRSAGSTTVPSARCQPRHLAPCRPTRRGDRPRVFAGPGAGTVSRELARGRSNGQIQCELVPDVLRVGAPARRRCTCTALPS